MKIALNTNVKFWHYTTTLSIRKEYAVHWTMRIFEIRCKFEFPMDSNRRNVDRALASLKNHHPIAGNQ